MPLTFISVKTLFARCIFNDCNFFLLNFPSIGKSLVINNVLPALLKYFIYISSKVHRFHFFYPLNGHKQERSFYYLVYKTIDNALSFTIKRTVQAFNTNKSFCFSSLWFEKSRYILYESLYKKGLLIYAELSYFLLCCLSTFEITMNQTHYLYQR